MHLETFVMRLELKKAAHGLRKLAATRATKQKIKWHLFLQKAQIVKD